MKNSDTPATKNDIADVRKDIDWVLDVLKSFMQQVDERFNSVEAWQKKTEAWQYSVEDRLSRMELRLDDLREEFRSFQTSVDGLAKRIADDDAERGAMARQLERHDRWVHELADKMGVALSSSRASQ
jgi:chromosome segregation ATPase